MANGYGPLRDRLAEGDRRTPGAAGAVAALVEAQPEHLAGLIDCLEEEDLAVVSHAAHASMQLSARRPDLFDAHVDALLPILDMMAIWEIGEQLPKVLVRCRLSPPQIARLAKILERNLDHRSNIVTACSLQAIVDLAQDGRFDRKAARRLLDKALGSDRKALAARARRLDNQLRSTE